MNIMFNRDKLTAAIKEKLDIADFIKTNTAPKQWRESANGEITCCSPLREDKKPSFSINSKKGVFNDLARTGVCGDIFNFVMLWQNCDFKAALQFLQGYAGINEAYIATYTPKPRIKTHAEKLAEEITEKQMQMETNIAALREAPTDDESAQKAAQMLAENAALDAEITELQAELYTELKAEHPESWQDAEELSQEAMQHGNKAEADTPKLKYIPSPMTANGIANKYAEIYKGKLLYTDAIGWLFWNGERWTPSEHIAVAYSRQLSADMLKEAAASGDIDYSKLAMKYQNAPNYWKAIPEATKHDFHIEAAKLDASPELLNTPGGVVNLRTGETVKNTPEMLLSKITACAPSDEAAPEWDAFLKLITGDNAEMVEYLQTVAGMAAIGKPTEQLIIAKGGGRNGKSTFFNALFKVMGEYAVSVSSDLLIADGRQNKLEQCADLRGARLAVCGELETGAKLSAATLKRVVSTDPMRIKKLYHDEETVLPSHSLILYTNHYPTTTATDAGTWRRLVPVPFNQTMPAGGAEIKNYDDFLVKHCGGAILKWIIDGARKYLANGSHLEEPEAVKLEKNEYQASQDWLADFITACCTVEAGKNVTTATAYKAYRQFAIDQGQKAVTPHIFREAMRQAGYKRVSIGKHMENFIGIYCEYTPGYTRYADNKDDLPVDNG